jgi:hypothetical protein
LFEYNYSHDNQGGFMLICTPVKRDETNNFGNTGTVIRDNVSWNDQNRLINLSGADDVQVENNVFYIAPDTDVQALLVSSWNGWSSNALFQDNTFYVEGHASFGHAVERDAEGKYTIAPGWGLAKDIRLSGNRYIGPDAEAPEGEHETVDKSGVVPRLLGGEPTFDPADPSQFKAFLQKHRIWMMAMLRDALKADIHLAS